MDDDGRTYYQERNFNDPTFRPPPPPPPPPPQLPQQTRQGNSANEQSRGYHYNERNTSFISAFSKADNERRRQFQPFRRGGGGQQNEEWNNNRVEPSGERLPRGVRYPPNREFGSFSPRRNDNRMMPLQEEYFEEGPVRGYFDEPYYYDDRPSIMGGGDGYLYEEMFEY